MKQIIKHLPLVKTSYQAIKNFFALYAHSSYSQEGEDLLLRRIFETQKEGFYVDVGAHHPFRFSNTYLFYKKGWRGINIDAMPNSMKIFNRFRPRDINLEMGVGEKEEELEYFIFNEPALNTFDSSKIEPILQKPCYKLIKTQKIPIKPLSLILDRFLPKNQSIDFLSIDVEGLDLQVLHSNHWEKYRPKFVLVEALGGIWKRFSLCLFALFCPIKTIACLQKHSILYFSKKIPQRSFK